MPYNTSLKKLWVAAGYSKSMGSSCVTQPPPPEWIRLYHFTRTEYALSNIANSRLKVALFSDLNDPFELMALNSRYGNVRRVVRQYRSAQNLSYGIVCLSEDWTNPVMWSHYADKHQGICLGFDVLRTSVEKVSYKDSRLLPELGESDEPCLLTNELQGVLRCTKYHHWRYEREQRIFVPLNETLREGPLHFRTFGDDIRLAEVILGPHCLEHEDDVRKHTCISHPSATVYASRLAYQYFRVVPLESSIP